MILADNDYPRFYGMLGDDGSRAVYLVVSPHERPVFKFDDRAHPEAHMHLSSVNYNEADVLETMKLYGPNSPRQWSALHPPAECGRITPRPDVAAKMLAFYQEAKRGRVR